VAKHYQNQPLSLPYCAALVSVVDNLPFISARDVSDACGTWYQRRFPGTVAGSSAMIEEAISKLVRKYTCQEMEIPKEEIERIFVFIGAYVGRDKPNSDGVRCFSEANFGDKLQGGLGPAIGLGRYTIRVLNLRTCTMSNLSFEQPEQDRISRSQFPSLKPVWSCSLPAGAYWKAEIGVVDTLGVNPANVGATGSTSIMKLTQYYLFEGVFRPGPEGRKCIVSKWQISGYIDCDQ